ncbi:MAG: hypothetical protein EOO81_02055, partial [Oxalobacteraceae bacterium]
MTYKPHDPSHLHAHLDGDARHSHSIEARSQKALAFAMGLTLLFALIEVITGFVSNSLALISVTMWPASEIRASELETK